jgi:hypothetical protein
MENEIPENPAIEHTPEKIWDKSERRKPEPTKEIKTIQPDPKYICPHCMDEEDYSTLNIYCGSFKNLTSQCKACNTIISLRNKDKINLKDRLDRFFKNK